jgi:hypothetical protein
MSRDGFPAFLGVTQMKDGTVWAAWADGSLAERRYEGARGYHTWVPIPSPSYADLFCATVSRETLEPGAPHD